MKQTLTTSQAASLLADDKNNGFSYSGAYALCEYYSEHESLHKWAADYFTDWREDLALPEGMAGHEEEQDAIRDYIQDHGQLIEFDGGIIVSPF